MNGAIKKSNWLFKGAYQIKKQKNGMAIINGSPKASIKAMSDFNVSITRYYETRQ